MRELILASGSPRRAHLMRTAGLEFTVLDADNSETEKNSSMGEADPGRHAALAAGAKLDAAMESGLFGECVVVCADTVVAVDGKIFGKPADGAEAAKMLHSLSGRSHDVITACAVAGFPEGPRVEFLEKTEVQFRNLTDEIIDEYINTGEPFDKAGAYGIQEKASAFVTGVNGCYANVVGLPVARLLKVLDGAFGVKVESFWKREQK